jgi:quercetin dioxygenase-like cupin family protein
LAGVMAMTPSSNAQVGLQRRLLLQQDLAIPGYEIVHAEASIAVGGREGKHWHPGTLIGHLLEGEMVLELEGKPTRRIKAGESVLIEPRQVHEGINTGSVPIKALTTFIVEKGKPLTTPTP